MPRFGKIAVLFVFLTLLSPTAVQAIETTLFQADEQTRFERQGLQEVTTRVRRADTWFNRNYRLIFWTIMVLPYLSLAGFIGFVLWDWRPPLRPVERNVPSVPFGSDEITVEDELLNNPDKWNALIEALRAVSKDNEQVADVLRQFRLL